MNQRRTFISGLSIGLLCSYVYFLVLSSDFLPYQNTRSIHYTRSVLQENSNEHAEGMDGPSQRSEDWKCKANSTFNFTAMMRIIQSERQYIMNRTCEQAEPYDVPKVELPYIQKSSLYSKNYKMSVCQIQKCGSSSWLRAIMVMENYYSVESYLKGEIIGKAVMDFSKDNVSIGSFQNKSEANGIWNKSLNVILVRNPFSRLVSAYFDKMVSNEGGLSSYYGPISRRISAKYRFIRHNITERTMPNNGEASFEDFVNFLCHENDIDEHWRSYDKICYPCLAKYDYIAKFETLKEDAEYLKKVLKISEYHTKAFFPKSYLRTNDEKTFRAFKKIPKALANKLYNLYKKDFEMFGYERPSWL